MGGTESTGREGLWSRREPDPGGGQVCQGALDEEKPLCSWPSPQWQTPAGQGGHTLPPTHTARTQITGRPELRVTRKLLQNMAAHAALLLQTEEPEALRGGGRSQGW